MPEQTRIGQKDADPTQDRSDKDLLPRSRAREPEPYRVDHQVQEQPVGTSELLQCKLVEDPQLRHQLGPRPEGAGPTGGAASKGSAPAQPIQLKAAPTDPQADLLTPSASPAAGAGWGRGVQAKMERAFSSDFSSVQLHANSPEPAKLGAEAFASGNDIHFAPGKFAPDSPSGQSLLGHELAHVVQQREGRVAADTQLSGGVGVNTSASLEAEADDWGARAARGEVVRGPGAARSQGSTSLSGAIQRKIGLEMQSTWRILSIDGRQTDSKDIAYRGYFFDIEVDAGNGHPELEIVTHPLRNRADVDAAIAEIVGVVMALTEQRGRRFTMSGGGWVGEVVIERTGAAPNFRLQYTEGVTVENIPKLMRDHHREAYKFLPDDIVDATDDTGSPGAALRGLRAAIDMFLGDASVYKPGRGDDGPKYAFTLMARTDFVSMYQTLSAEEQAQFAEMVGLGRDRPTHFHAFDLRAPVFPGLGKGGLTVGEWLRSIAQGRPASVLTHDGYDEHPRDRQAKDLMSPPPGYDPHDAIDQHNAAHPDRPLMKYAMGMYGMDEGNLALYEDRAAGSPYGDDLAGTVRRVDGIMAGLADRDPRFAAKEDAEEKGARPSRRAKRSRVGKRPAAYQPNEAQEVAMAAANVQLVPIAANGFCIFASIGAVTGLGGAEVQARVLHALRDGHVAAPIRAVIAHAATSAAAVRHAVANIYTEWASAEADIIPEITAIALGVGLDVIQPNGATVTLNGGGGGTLVRVNQPLDHYHATGPAG